jgi:hypothetical protein
VGGGKGKAAVVAVGVGVGSVTALGPVAVGRRGSTTSGAGVTRSPPQAAIQQQKSEIRIGLRKRQRRLCNDGTGITLGLAENMLTVTALKRFTDGQVYLASSIGVLNGDVQMGGR